jgi:heptaprenyl diphosphate synthase
MVFHNEFDGRNCAAIADQIMDYALPFKAAHPTASNKQMLKALLVVFPNIEPRLFTVLDECHSKIKPKMVELGLMVGQFHPDVMFLGDNSQTFRAYDKEFGFQFAEHGKSLSRYQEHLFAYYERARSKHSTS